MSTVVTYGVLFLAALAVLGTVLPFSKSSAWWVRCWDYPKTQLLLLALVALALWLAFAPGGFAGWHLWVTLALVAVSVYHARWILPMTPIWRKEVAPTQSDDDPNSLSVLSANVLMENRDAAPLIEQIEKLRPDVVLLLETDQWWIDAMKPVTDGYAVSRAQPQDNHYGLLFMTNCDVVDHEVIFRVTEDIPSINARLRFPDGQTVSFIGLHPPPPTPGVDTTERDAELVLVAKEVQAITEPAIVAGDLNDVAWSHTTRLFRRISGMLDPRVGRGLYSTFHAEHWFIRWPLDHLFHTHHFTLRKLKILPYIGSDHFPYFLELSLCADAKEENADPGEMVGDDAEEAREIIRDGLEAAENGTTP